jgi:hypothetical protein
VILPCLALRAVLYMCVEAQAADIVLRSCGGLHNVCLAAWNGAGAPSTPVQAQDFKPTCSCTHQPSCTYVHAVMQVLMQAAVQAVLSCTSPTT